MGWKNIKEHYRIDHSVCVTSEGICIGSPYIHNLITISLPDTKLHYEHNFKRTNDDLARYVEEIEDDPVKLNELANTLDTFSRSIPSTPTTARRSSRRCAKRQAGRT